MKLNKKYFLAIFTVLLTHGVFSLNFANAALDPNCENVIQAENGSKYFNSFNLPGQSMYLAGNACPNAESRRKKHNDHIAKHGKIYGPLYLDACVFEKLCETAKKRESTSSNSAIDTQENSSSSGSSNQTTNSNSAELSQENSSPEDVERNNVRSYSAQQTAAYQEKYKGRGKKHNLDAFANRCIKTKGKKVLNTCDFDIEVVFCAKNPDPNSKHAFEMANGFDCARNSKGMWGISANDALMGVFTADSVSVFACKKPSLPGAEIDPQTLSLVGRCGEY